MLLIECNKIIEIEDGKILVEVKNINKSFDNRIIFDDAEFTV